MSEPITIQHISTRSSSVDEKGDEKEDNVKVQVVELVNNFTIAEGDYSPEQYKLLVTKIDRYLLRESYTELNPSSRRPISLLFSLTLDFLSSAALMWWCYGIQQSDKTSLSTQALFGMREDTGLVGQQYAWL